MLKLIFTTLFLAFGLAVSAQTMPAAVKKVSDKYACASCHAPNMRLVGPSWQELAKKNYSSKQMLKLIQNPKPANWPSYPPMAPIPSITTSEVKLVADWLESLN